MIQKKILETENDEEAREAHYMVAKKLKQLMSNKSMFRNHNDWILHVLIFLGSLRELRKLQSHSNFKSFVKKFGRDYKSNKEYKRR